MNENENTVDMENAEDIVEDVDTDAGINDETADPYEYDEDGNIIFDDNEDEAEDDGSFNKEAEETKAEDNEEPEKERGDDGEKNESKESENPVKAEPDERDAEITALKEKYEKLKAHSRDALDKLGYAGEEDIVEGLIKVAADSEDKDVETYKKERAESIRAKEAQKLLAAKEFEETMAKDLAEIKSYWPDANKYKSIREFPPEVLSKFAEYRDKGIPARDAYAAANPDGIRNYTVSAAKQKAMNDSKQHIKSNVPVGSKDTSFKISKAELEYYREFMPGKTDKEIVDYYRRTMTKK